MRISELIEQARMRVKTTVDTAMVYTYFSAGRYIVMDEQQGHHRAEYGKQKLQELSELLTQKYGNGWSYSNLRQMRQFYLVYGNLTDTVYQIPSESTSRPLANSTKSSSIEEISQIIDASNPHFTLS